MKVLKLVDHWIERITTAICSILFVAIIVIGFTEVVFRYILNNPIMWSEEIMRFCAIWMILLGSSLTMREDSHTSIDFLPTFFLKSKKAQVVHLIITRSLCAIALIFFIPYSLELMKKMGNALGAATRLPMKYIYLAFPIGAVLTVIGTIKMLPEKSRDIMSGKTEEEADQ